MDVGVGEVALRLGVSPRRVQQLAAAGELSYRVVSGRLLIDDQALRHEPARSRPMSDRMAWAFIDVLSGRDLIELSAQQRYRLRDAVRRLHADQRPAGLLRSWLKGRAPRVQFAAHPGDIADLALDPRLVLSGVSDPRAGMAAGHEVEAYLDPSDVKALRLDYALSLPDPPMAPANVHLHLRALSSPEPPVGLVIADLADHHGPREDGRIDELLQDLR